MTLKRMKHRKDVYNGNLFHHIHNIVDHNTQEQPVCKRKTRHSFLLLFLASIDTLYYPGQNRHFVIPRRLQRLGELLPSIQDIWLHNVEKEPASRGAEFLLRR